jgi:hypothetical protein
MRPYFVMEMLIVRRQEWMNIPYSAVSFMESKYLMCYVFLPLLALALICNVSLNLHVRPFTSITLGEETCPCVGLHAFL